MILTDLISKGDVREVYRHPDNADLCVKIDYVQGHYARKRKTPAQIKYYRWLEQRAAPFDMMTRFHGCIDTNFGRGYVFDLIRDDGGAVARPITDYFHSSEFTETHYQSILGNLRAYRRYFIDNRIIGPSSHLPNNVYALGATKGTGRLFSIDSLGANEFVSVFSLNKHLAGYKANRKWRRLIRSMSVRWRRNGVLQEILRDSEVWLV